VEEQKKEKGKPMKVEEVEEWKVEKFLNKKKKLSSIIADVRLILKGN